MRKEIIGIVLFFLVESSVACCLVVIKTYTAVLILAELSSYLPLIQLVLLSHPCR